MTAAVAATGRFITFEGIEGVGKTTQIVRVHEHLAAQGRAVVRTREPGGTPLAERIRDVVLGASGEPVPAAAELMLMFAARAVHTENLIRPALARGESVLCDRYTDATYAYQGGGRGVPDREIATLAGLAHPGLAPDMTFLLDAPVQVALARARSRTASADRIEAETVAFFERARAKYLEIARREPDRVRVVDATRSPDEVAAAILRHLAELRP
jgi:dTMP kinase